MPLSSFENIPSLIPHLYLISEEDNNLLTAIPTDDEIHINTLKKRVSLNKDGHRKIGTAYS